MIKIEIPDVNGWEAAIRGMRNPMKSWRKSDSIFVTGTVWHTIRGVTGLTQDLEGNYGANDIIIGPEDMTLMKSLTKQGKSHSKFLRFVNVTCDITAPDYFWKEYATYKVGTVENSTSTMHKITSRDLTLDDFSHEDLFGSSLLHLEGVIKEINRLRGIYVHGGNIPARDLGEGAFDEETKIVHVDPGSKEIWRQIIQLLPMSFNYRRTVSLNYTVLQNMYEQRKNHKLVEWRAFCTWIEYLPYSELITGKKVMEVE